MWITKVQENVKIVKFKSNALENTFAYNNIHSVIWIVLNQDSWLGIFNNIFLGQSQQ